MELRDDYPAFDRNGLLHSVPFDKRRISVRLRKEDDGEDEDEESNEIWTAADRTALVKRQEKFAFQYVRVFARKLGIRYEG